MDIFNRPPSIAEDTLQYTIYPAQDARDSNSVAALATILQEYVDSLIPGHIWHRDTFELKIVRDTEVNQGVGFSGTGYLWLLEGCMRVGDCVDDEWCVVWLLREISKRWDVVISVWDTDGEFLLIEAAEALPAWVTPTNAENRVWIYASKLHLIPLSHVSAPSSKRRRLQSKYARNRDDEGTDDLLNASHDRNENEYLSVHDALLLVRDKNVDTEAPVAVTDAVWRRIEGYPAALAQHIHKTKAHLPVDVARALSTNPSLVQKAVETFYTRDAIQLRAAHKMSRFPPQPSALRTVRMTRTAYAQLLGQKFHPPKVFGRWPEKEGTKEWKWRDVGMKIACGFEMLYQEGKRRNEAITINLSDEASATRARHDALRRSIDYQAYIKSLMKAGYFEGELEGSQRWNELESRAIDTYLNVRKDDDATRPSFATQVEGAVSRAPTLEEALKDSQSDEDSDDWLNIDAEDFDEVLERTMGRGSSSGVTNKDPAHSESAMAADEERDQKKREEREERVAKQQASRLQDLAKKVEDFVEGKGDLDGARFADDPDSESDKEDDAMSDFSDEQFSDSDDEDTEDEAAYARQRREDMDKLVAPLGPGEYGRMPPSFHENSQQFKEEESQEQDGDDSRDIAQPRQHADAASKKQPTEEPVRSRPPLLPRDKYEGVDSDDESDDEAYENPFQLEEDGEDEEDRPQIVGEMEIDMKEEEEEFLEFSRKALGISDEQWGDIIRERRGEEVTYVPAGVLVPDKAPTRAPQGPRAAEHQGSATESRLRNPQPGPRPDVNPDLDSFESVMRAMDAELSRIKGAEISQKKAATTVTPGKSVNSSTAKGKGKAKSGPSEEENDEGTGMDIEEAMDAELRNALQHGPVEDDDNSDFEFEEGEGMDYAMIKNFLESFKSQAGLPGPVGNLAGRLQPGWTLPRDNS